VPTDTNHAPRRQIHSLGEHHGEGLCLCTVDENGDLFEDEDHGELVIHPACPCTGHTVVSRVQFSDDGALVVSGGHEETVLNPKPSTLTLHPKP